MGRPEDLTAVASNYFQCRTSVATGVGTGRTFRRGSLTLQRSALDSITAAAHTEAVGLRYARFSRPGHEKLAEVLCILPRSREVIDRAKTRISAMMFAEPMGGGLNVGSALGRVGRSLADAWGDPTLECWYDPLQDTVECDGVRCTPYAQLRTASAPGANSSGVYYCSNGCAIIGFSYYECASGGGGDVSPPPDGGGGSAPGAEQCDFAESLCVRPLTPAEREKILAAFTTFAYSSDDPQCLQAFDSFLAIWDLGRVFGGNPDRPEAATHVGEYDPGPPERIHIDSDYLAASGLRGIMMIALHEGWHAAGYNHPRGEQYPYAEAPFSKMDACTITDR